MKKKAILIGFILIAILAVLPFGLELLTPQKVNEVTLTIDGMTCEACEVTLTKTVTSLPGVVSATFSHTEKKGTIIYKEADIGISQISQAIEDKNYTVNRLKGNDMEVIDAGIHMQGLSH